METPSVQEYGGSSGIWRLNFAKRTRVPKALCRFNEVPIGIPLTF